MPHTDWPKINLWVPHLAKVVGEPDENTYFVGHSIGCQTILRYLETIDVQVGGVVFVAGWFKLRGVDAEEEEVKIARPWLETPIDFGKVKKSCKNFAAILSDDDPYVPLEANRKMFEEELGAKIIVKERQGHFSGGSGTIKLPVVLEELLEMVRGEK